jgi:glycosyltransferase involved in cell wall biosynthesis
MPESFHIPVIADNTLRKVLIITYYWPPSGGAGVQRWLKFAKYLPESGWKPVILTVNPEYASYPQYDEELLKEVPPEMEVHLSKSPTGVFSTYRKITGKKEIPYGGFANESNAGFLQKTMRFIRGNFFFPDARVGWNRYAYKEASRIIKENNIEIVITTSPPHSTQLTGLKLKKKLNIKWIADLRDPWTDIYYSGEMYQTLPARKINSLLESRVLNSADRVIATCNTTRDLFRAKLTGNRSPEKVITLTNGFDPDDFKNLTSAPDRFTITYLGTIARNYDLEVLTKAIDYCSGKTGSAINLCFVGSIDDHTVAVLRENKNILLQMVPYVEHKKAMEYLVKSAALLLVVPSGGKTTEMIPGKLFEYLASGRPVIAIGPRESDVAEILHETNGGRIFERSESEQLGEYILELMNNYNKGIIEAGSTGTDYYSRRNLVKKAADIINSI